MTAEEKMFSVLSGAATVTALVPADRIKPRGDWQNVPRPYIEHFPVAAAPIRTHSGLAKLQIWPFYQISIFAGSMGLAATIRDTVIAALDGYHDDDMNLIAYQGIGSTDYDAARKVAFMALIFDVAEGLRA